jgi:hypothetical protein
MASNFLAESLGPSRKSPTAISRTRAGLAQASAQ